MMTKNETPSVSHSDIDIQSQNAAYGLKSRHRKIMQTMTNIADQHGPSPKAYQLADQIVSLGEADYLSRIAHQVRFRSTLSVPNNEYAVTPSTENIVETALVDFDTRIQGFSDEEAHEYWQSVGKGVSGELGYVEQLGNWTAARSLDDEVRRLSRSEMLARTGITLTHIHDRADAFVNYRFAFIPLDVNTPIYSVRGVRKRAVADATGSDGEEFELLRRSSFLVNSANLNDGDTADLSSLFMFDRAKDLTEEQIAARKELNRKLGQKIIEPFIDDKSLRTDSLDVLPVTSLYFALSRHK